MIRLQGRFSRLAATLLCASIMVDASAGTVTIQAFDQAGQLTFNTLNIATNYRLEWASSPAGPWSTFPDAAAALHNIPATAEGTITCSVPMCYRIVASVTNAWPIIDLEGDLAFGDVFEGTTATRTFTILNRGAADLTVMGIEYPEGFNGTWAGIVHAGGSRSVTVTFAPTTEGAHGGMVSLASNSEGGTSSLAVSGNALPRTYVVVDLSGGTTATTYPVSYLSAVPLGGWTDEYKTTNLVLRWIPATSPDFTMGSPPGEVGRSASETQHAVMLTKGFYIGVFEVTQRQWELAMGDKPSYFNNAAYYQTRPVEQVTYYDIRENPLPFVSDSSKGSAINPNWPQTAQVYAGSFMGKLRAKTRLSTMDLPTESQWEYACRAGTTTALNSGYNLTSTTSDARMNAVGRYWYNGGSDASQACAPNAGTATVGSYLPNIWGLYDMHGNVFEWCRDWFGALPGSVSDPAGATSGVWRINRGGDWTHDASIARSASRVNRDPFQRYRSFGFRVALQSPDHP